MTHITSRNVCLSGGRGESAEPPRRGTTPGARRGEGARVHRAAASTATAAPFSSGVGSAPLVTRTLALQYFSRRLRRARQDDCLSSRERLPVSETRSRHELRACTYACIRFHLTRRNAHTATTAQVRRDERARAACGLRHAAAQGRRLVVPGHVGRDPGRPRARGARAGAALDRRVARRRRGRARCGRADLGDDDVRPRRDAARRREPPRAAAGRAGRRGRAREHGALHRGPRCADPVEKESVMAHTHLRPRAVSSGEEARWHTHTFGRAPWVLEKKRDRTHTPSAARRVVSLCDAQPFLRS